MKSNGKAYYINLAHRLDRRTEIEGELDVFRSMSIETERIDAVLDLENGAIGCAGSHIKALIAFLSQPTLDWSFIFEDDFRWSCSALGAEVRVRQIIDLHQSVDSVLLAYNKPIASNLPSGDFVKIYSAQTMSGYFVTRRFAYDLSKHLIDAHASLVACRRIRPVQIANSISAIDVVWKPLLARSKVLGVLPALGTQRPSFSDIENRKVDYGV
jgi:hypothetical protein